MEHFTFSTKRERQVKLLLKGVAKDFEVAEHFYKLNRLLDLTITVTPYEKQPVPQRHNCQGIGHSSACCSLKPMCVVCSEPHKGVCTAEKRKCVNCGGEHIANYRGCEAIKKAEAVRSQKKTRKYIGSR